MYDDGQLLNWYGQPAVNDDGFDGPDSVLQDVLLPADGTYYIEVEHVRAVRYGRRTNYLCIPIRLAHPAVSPAPATS